MHGPPKKRLPKSRIVRSKQLIHRIIMVSMDRRAMYFTAWRGLSRKHALSHGVALEELEDESAATAPAKRASRHVACWWRRRASCRLFMTMQTR
jgi:hypothetical protein